MQVFENFISYRRRESMLEVKNIYDALQTKGFSTFCDVYSLGSGEFNQELITAIDNCTNFILVLGAHSHRRELKRNVHKTKGVIEKNKKKFMTATLLV